MISGTREPMYHAWSSFFDRSTYLTSDYRDQAEGHCVWLVSDWQLAISETIGKPKQLSVSFVQFCLVSVNVCAAARRTVHIYGRCAHIAAHV